MTEQTEKTKKTIAGWREWVQLPQLEIPEIKAKLDTGARTSALHAFDLEPFEADGRLQVRFAIHPYQLNDEISYICIADVVEKRFVKDSGGHVEERYVIRTPVRLGAEEWPIEITLTNRDQMRFRMLLGRSALRSRFVVDSGGSFLMGNIK